MHYFIEQQNIFVNFDVKPINASYCNVGMLCYTILIKLFSRSDKGLQPELS